MAGGETAGCGGVAQYGNQIETNRRGALARIRSVKPEFWEDQELAEQVSRDGRFLYIGLWNLADEHGRLRGAPVFIHGRVFPYEPDLTIADTAELLEELARAGKVVKYRAAGGDYLFLPNLDKHQRLESEKVASKLPDPDADGSEVLPPRALTEPRPAHGDPGGAQIDSDESAPGADKRPLLYGTGSMEHVDAHRAEPVRDRPDETALIPPPSTPTPSTAPKLRSWSEKQILADPNWIKFWDAYPNRKDRRKALMAWLNALKRGVSPDLLIDAALAYRDNPRRDPKYTPHPTTWLNGDRWEDEDVAVAPPKPQEPGGTPAPWDA